MSLRKDVEILQKFFYEFNLLYFFLSSIFVPFKVNKNLMNFHIVKSKSD